MSDFLEDLEHELLAAARRRRDRRQDARALGAGATFALSVTIVAAVLALGGGLSGRHRQPVTSLATPPRTAAPAADRVAVTLTRQPAGPCAGTVRMVTTPAPSALRPWLDAALPASGAERRSALRDLDRTAAPTAVLYVDDVRAVTLPGLGRVLVLAARGCAPTAVGGPPTPPRPLLLLEVPARGHRVATVAVHRPGISAPVLVRTGHSPTLVSTVASRVVRVVCRWPGGVTRAAVVVDRLVAIPEATPPHDCRAIAS